MRDRQGTRRALTLLWRGLCLRCPRCGAQSLFRGWFAMHERCTVCQLRFEREQGYFVGAMYINYGVTAVLALAGYYALEWWGRLSFGQQLGLWCGFSIVFPLFFFRYARSLWLSFDYIFNPDDSAGAAPPEA